jgi:hypothetical protein
MDPTEEEVAAAVDEVWVQVAELAASPLGVALMEAAVFEYPEHNE